MEKRISATRAVRDFSEVLNTIKFKGVQYIIERGGKPVASIMAVSICTMLNMFVSNQEGYIVYIVYSNRSQHSCVLIAFPLSFSFFFSCYFSFLFFVTFR